MILVKVLKKTAIQHGSKLKSFIHPFLFFRFGTGGRKDVRRTDWPGPGDTNVPEYTTNGRKIKLQK